MKIRFKIALLVFCLLGYGCGSSQLKKNEEVFLTTDDGPLEIQMETDKRNKEEIAGQYRKPSRIVKLETSKSGCIERWYYEGESDLGFGKMEVAMYVDFDNQDEVCK